MSTIFPSSPTIGDTYNGYIWTGTAWDITGVDLTASYQPLVASVSSTELGYLDGVTSAIQTQLDAKSTASKSETLTNKTVNLTSNTLTGTISQFNTALSDDNFETINGYDYPKNKTFDNTNRLMGAYFPATGYNTNQGDYGLANTTNNIVYISGSTADSNFSLPPTTYLNYGEYVIVFNISTVSVNVKTNSGTLVNILDSGQAWKYTYVNTTGTGIIGGWIGSQDGFSDGRINISATTTSDVDPLTIKSKNGHGGSGFAGFVTLENTQSGATNTKKYIRMNSTGGLEIVNNAYTANIFTLEDSGNITNVNNISANGTISGTNISDSGWQTVSSFANSYTGSNVAYRKLNGVVYMRGRVNGGTAGAGAFTLPSGYRPSTIEAVIPVQQYGTANINYITVGTDGVVVPNGNAAWLSGVCFPLG